MELYLFTNPMTDPVLQDLEHFRQKVDKEAGYRAARALLDFAARRGKTGYALREYAVYTLLDSPGAGELVRRESIVRPYLEQDISRFFQLFYAFDWEDHCARSGMLPFPQGEAVPICPQWLTRMVRAKTEQDLEDEILAFYGRYHDRDEARYAAFLWKDGRLQGIRRADPQRFDQLAGLDYQKEALQKNAESFLKGLPAHNVLLSGGSGTGKSSCVKATLTAYAHRGLRMVELPKQKVGELPQLMKALEHKRCKYIIYIDDLSFEGVDDGYRELKVALDGQVEERLSHVLIYVTSNRRRLIREVWADRDMDGDIHENDTQHEKMSLSERFGLHLTFGALNQREYFQIVELLLSFHGVDFTEEIGKAAASWALNFNGRSGRTAKQFVADYISRSGRQA